MTGRHAINRDVALSALNSPAGRGLAAAMAVGTMFGVALPTASADDNGSDKAFGGRVTDLSTADSSKNTTAVTAPANATWKLEQVHVEGAAATAQSVSTVKANVQAPPPVVDESAKEKAKDNAATQQQSDTASATLTRATVRPRTAAPATSGKLGAVKQSDIAARQADTSSVQEAAAAPSGNGSSVLNTALSYVGSPYRWGGTTPSGWDCIGFVRYVYGKHGVNIGGYTTSVLSAGTRVPYSQARPGDILYWPGHVGIYAGNGKNVGAWNESMGTRVGPNSWVGGTPTVIRVL